MHRVLITCLLIAGAVPAFAQSDSIREAFERGLDRVDLEEAARKSGMPEQFQPVILEHMQRVMRDPEVRNFIIDEFTSILPMLERQGNTPNEAEILTFVRDYGAALVQDKTAQGIKRLPVSDQRQFYIMLSDLMAVMPPAVCSSFLNGEMAAQDGQSAELAAVGKMSEAFVRTWLRISGDATLAEIRDRPMHIPLSVTERVVAEALFQDSLAQNLAAHPQRAGIEAAFADMRSASHEDVCAMGIMTFEAVTTAKGTAGDWAVRMMSEM